MFGDKFEQKKDKVEKEKLEKLFSLVTRVKHILFLKSLQQVFCANCPIFKEPKQLSSTNPLETS